LGLFAAVFRRVIAAWLIACPIAHAQVPPKPVADDGPRFEIRNFRFEGATLVSAAKLAEATSAFAGPKRSFSDVQRALEAVERTYSSAGWSAVQVVLPEQELDKGEIRFQIIEAKIGRVIVEGNKFFDEANIRASAPSLTPGKAPNVNEIARNIRIANENPTKQATVLLRSGQEEATVDAVLRVTDERPQKFSVTVDNSGNAATGVGRIGLGYLNSNVAGGDEVLTLQWVISPYSNHVTRENEINRLSLYPTRKVTILGVGYRVPLYSLGDTLDFTFGYSNVNSGVIPQLNFSITGQGSIYGVRYTRNLDKIGDYEHRLALSQEWRT
jgi:hemolysin activation/secretion protein